MRFIRTLTDAAIVLALTVALFGFTAYDRDQFMYTAAATVRPVDLPFGTGSGVVLRPGVVVTAAHVVATGIGGSTVDGWEIADILYSDPVVDLAILSVPGIECPCADLARTDPHFLEEIFIVGYPGGMGIKVGTEGRMQDKFDDGGYLTTAPASSGNSGGGAFNEDGDLVGVLLAVATASVIGSAELQLRSQIPYLTLTADLDQIKEALLCADGIGLCNATP